MNNDPFVRAVRFVGMRCLLCWLLLGLTVPSFGADRLWIVVPGKASPMEAYAARELQRYVGVLTGVLPEVTNRVPAGDFFLLGSVGELPLVDSVLASGARPEEQGYVLKSLSWKGHRVMVIGATE